MAKQKERKKRVYKVISIHPTYASEEERFEAQFSDIKEWAIAVHHYNQKKKEQSLQSTL